MKRLVWIFLVAPLSVSCHGPLHGVDTAKSIVPNPSGGGTVGEILITAPDGRSKHRWISYSHLRTCFQSDLDGIDAFQARDIKYQLIAFRDDKQSASDARRASNAEVALRGASAIPLDPNTPPQAPLSMIEVCFPTPTIIDGDTSFIVLHVERNEADGGIPGPRDGVWQLSK